jgi:hypothetical protein
LLPECSCRNKFSCALGKGGVKPGVVTIEECIECKIEGASQNDFVTPEGFPSQAEVSIVVEGWDADAREFAENVRDHWISDDLSFGSVHYKTGDSFSTFGIDATAKSFSSFSDVMIYYGTSPSQALIDSQPSGTAQNLLGLAVFLTFIAILSVGIRVLSGNVVATPLRDSRDVVEGRR